jgi:hypothetical protein
VQDKLSQLLAAEQEEAIREKAVKDSIAKENEINKTI